MAVRLDPGRYLLAGGLAIAAAAIGLLAGLQPRLAITASLGIAFVLIVFADLAAGLAIFGFLGFIELVPDEGAFLSIAKFAGLLLALSWLARTTTHQGEDENLLTAFPSLAVLLGLLLAWSALSLTWAENPAQSYEPISRYGLNVLLFLVVFTAVRDRDDARLTVSAFLAGAATAAVYGALSVDQSGARLANGLLDPNEFAAVLLAGMALSVGVISLNKGRPVVQLLALTAGGVCLAGILLTASRGGLIALGVALVFAILVAGRWRLAVGVGAAALVLIVGFYVNALASDQEQARITQVTRGETRVEEGRTTIWQVGWRVFQSQPVHGIGIGNFQTSSHHFLLRPGSLNRSDQIISANSVAHNTYLEVLAELGVVGLALFASIIAFSLGAMLAAARHFAKLADRAMQAFCLALAVALVGSLAADFFISEEYSKQLWLLLGLGPAVLMIARSASAKAEAMPAEAGAAP